MWFYVSLPDRGYNGWTDPCIDSYPNSLCYPVRAVNTFIDTQIMKRFGMSLPSLVSPILKAILLVNQLSNTVMT